jgi:crotonobetainyl-CoA:carnitine CoA-transferase CaiB-like acyl-CoA transferase
VVVACRDDDDWQRLRAAVDSPELHDDRFSGLAGRIEHEDDLDRVLAAWVRQRDAAEVATELIVAGVPASVVKSPRERIDEDPDLARWGLFPTVHHPELGAARVEGLPLHLSETDWSIGQPGPCLGEHNDFVLGCLLGLDASEIEGLQRDGVI